MADLTALAPLPYDKEGGEVRWLEYSKVRFDLFESNQSPNLNLEGVWWYPSTTPSGPTGWRGRVLGMVEGSV